MAALANEICNHPTVKLGVAFFLIYMYTSLLFPGNGHLSLTLDCFSIVTASPYYKYSIYPLSISFMPLSHHCTSFLLFSISHHVYQPNLIQQKKYMCASFVIIFLSKFLGFPTTYIPLFIYHEYMTYFNIL